MQQIVNGGVIRQWPLPSAHALFHLQSCGYVLTIVGNRRYPYTADLWALDRARPREVPGLLPELAPINSPVFRCLNQWKESLASHPDRPAGH